MRGLTIVLLATMSVTSASAQQQQQTDSFDSTRFGALQWRSIGPYRGGRAVAVTGVPTQPNVFYAGYTGGGLWKTTDAGTNWSNISDCCFHMGSVGAVAVANSDPNVVYVGMGEYAVRGQSSSWGDGVYKSTDAGKSWTHIGLEKTRQISAVVVHPSNDDIVYVAAQGTRWGPSAERGIYKSIDGGKSWKLVLHPSDSAGASALSMDAANPRILYAAFWDGYRVPWQIRSGGTHGGIWKSTDSGEHWTKLGGGLPKMMGQVGVAVSPADPDRVYAAVEADSGGLWRSDDAGKTWRLLSRDRSLIGRAWYYMNVTADPENADVVYVMNADIMKSIDGGRTFSVLRAPHGDNHQLWIDPRDNSVMINANDGGVNVTADGGHTWSTQNNQPTAQIYHVVTDDRFPYWVYGAQQDNTPVMIPSATSSSEITAADWRIGPGGETAHLAMDPANPRYVYGTGYAGSTIELDTRTDHERTVQPWPNMGLGQRSNAVKYRYNWSAPVITSPHDRNVIYVAGNVVFRSSDRGTTWTVISPDLTRDDPATQGPGGVPFTNDGAGGETYNTIFSIVESPHSAGTIWVGTDDGLVQLTRDGGRTWTNVTPKGLPVGQVNELDVSPFDPGTVYMVLYRVKWNDPAPYIYRTTDYGKTWTSIAKGLPPDEAARVVREDPHRRGTLYAGTETGAWVSFDDGATWRSLQSNLPHVPVTDIRVAHGDIVISTEGRAFWIMDDIRPLALGLDTTSTTRLFAPSDANRHTYGTMSNPSGDAAGGENPPSGATIYFYLPHAADSAGVTIAIVDAEGHALRTLSSRHLAPIIGADTVKPITVKAGLNRLIWDLRVDPPTSLNIPLFYMGAAMGYRVPSGTYTVRLTVDGKTYPQPLRILEDPVVTLTADDIARRQQVAMRVYARQNDVFSAARDIRNVREQVTHIVRFAAGRPHADSLVALGDRMRATIDSLELALIPVKTTGSQDLINFTPSLMDQLVYISNAVDASETAPGAPVTDRLAELDQRWTSLNAAVRTLLERDVPAFNALVGNSAVAVPHGVGSPEP